MSGRIFSSRVSRAAIAAVNRSRSLNTSMNNHKFLGVLRPVATCTTNYIYNTTTTTTCRSFSAEAEEETIIPGVGKGKTSTGLVGLAVEPDWYNVMIDKFQALLDRMEESDMPETAQYRIDVTKWCNYVLRVTKENPTDPEAVEDACRSGQVEELIEQAKDEMEVLEMYLETRMWELVAQSNPKVDFDPNPLQDYFDPEEGDEDVARQMKEGMDEMKEENEAEKK